MVIPTTQLEKKLFNSGYKNIAGADEVGRGSLAGPMVAAAVIFPIDRFPQSPLVRDSKSLSHKQRLVALAIIRKTALGVGIGVISPQYIDKFGIVQANRTVITRAVANLTITPDFLLIDGNLRFEISLPYQSVIKGDAISTTIAAASIVAKITRDELMVRADSQYPGYFFADNKGYGSKYHLASLKQRHICPLHRKTFVSHIVKI